MYRIIFVCHGNICRSPMGEFILKNLIKSDNILKDKVLISSAAVSYEEQGNSMYPPAKQILTQHNIPFSQHHAHRITQKEASDADLILIMDRSNENLLKRIISDDNMKKVRYLSEFCGDGNCKDIADPWFTGDFEKTFREIEAACRGLLQYAQVNII